MNEPSGCVYVLCVPSLSVIRVELSEEDGSGRRKRPSIVAVFAVAVEDEGAPAGSLLAPQNAMQIIDK